MLQQLDWSLRNECGCHVQHMMFSVSIGQSGVIGHRPASRFTRVNSRSMERLKDGDQSGSVHEPTINCLDRSRVPVRPGHYP